MITVQYQYAGINIITGYEFYEIHIPSTGVLSRAAYRWWQTDQWAGWSQSMRRRWRKAHPDRLRHQASINTDCCIHCGITGIQTLESKSKICRVRPHP